MDNFEEREKTIQDPITLKIFEDPYILDCHHTFSKSVLDGILKNSKYTFTKWILDRIYCIRDDALQSAKCPTCGKEFTSSTMRHDYAMCSMIATIDRPSALTSQIFSLKQQLYNEQENTSILSSRVYLLEYDLMDAKKSTCIFARPSGNL